MVFQNAFGVGGLPSRLRVVLPVVLYVWKQSFAVVNSVILIILLRPFRQPILDSYDYVIKLIE